MPFPNRETVLQDILQTCRSIKATTRAPQTKPSHPPQPPIPFSFPPIPNLTPPLHAIGLPDHISSTLVQIFHSKCTQLQRATERIFHEQDLTLLSSTNGSAIHPNNLQTCVLKLYNQNVEYFQSEILRRAKIQCDQWRTAVTTHAKPAKAAFNHDFVPVLEKYFEYNAYPSAADRALIARKSMMTERQIEVWFQNHRNRARKDGKPLARLRASDLLPSDVSFDSLDAAMGYLIRPEGERLMMEQQEDEDDDSDGIEALASSLNVASCSRASSVDSDLGTPATTSQPTLAQDALNPSTPPFAYPAPYVPQLHTFLGATSRPAAFTFPKPTWARQPSATRSDVTSTRIPRREVDAFAELFARLNVRESAKKQGRRRIAPLPQSRNSPVPQPRYASPAATCAITTILCPGRHPALIPPVAPCATRRARKSPSLPPPPYESSWMSSPGAGPSKPSTSTSSPTASFTFQSPPQYSQSAAPTNPPVNALPKASTSTPRRQKSPQLPRRVPGSPPVTRPYSQSQTTSHPTPQRFPRPSHHPYASPSRASSSASSSSHRVSSSSSSSASSSTPTTPNGSTMLLPISYPINTPKNAKPTSPLFTAQNIVDIFGDAAAFATPSSQGFSGFGTAGFASPDFGRMPMGNMFNFNFNTSHGPSIVQARS
uniref:Homeodomain 2 mating type protein n=1 Tax=Pleurotus tuoliensis TaxID=879823 RepID=G8DA02_9AGAR|nr:homeodomain 2 mating type protein [Pleurotus tuoliensis]